MKTGWKKVLIFVGCIYAKGLFAQVCVYHQELLPKMKEGTTYVLMRDTASPGAEAYKDIFKKYWTFSKIRFIAEADAKQYIAPGNTFFNYDGYYMAGTNPVTGLNDASIGSRDYKYVWLWGYGDSFFEAVKKGKAPPYEKQYLFGRIELWVQWDADKQSIMDSLYDGTPYIRNWGPGIFKNQLQQLMYYLDKGVNKESGDLVEEKEKIKTLKTKTLYAANDVLVKFNGFNGDESKRLNEKDVFGNYKYPYKLISREELNEKIMNDKESFYYLSYVKNNAEKYIALVDSQTGQLIYMRHTMGYNLKSGDLSRIASIIKKK